MSDPPHDTLLDALRARFGHAEFRGPQRAICEHVVAGGDAFVVMATGDGKSLCYQLPALLRDGLTLVVSPLIALMEDQVSGLRARGIPASCVHSLLERGEREARIQAALRGELKILYCTPERFRVPGFLQRILGARIALLAIDEAHCLSQWGHDFRPDYARLGDVRSALGDPPTIALTATATPAVQADVRKTLRIEAAPLWHTGVERKNLFLAVREVHDKEAKLERLLAIVARVGGPGIVYCALIKELAALEVELKRRGFRPLIYHGDLSASERKEQQARFVSSTDALILATNAFGMGVDKPDIRFIVHWQMPRTLEAYSQEIGRAGRDGKAALCELLLFAEDISVQREFTEWANPDAAFLARVVDVLAHLGDRVQTFDVDALRDVLLLENRRDGRVDTCLRLLRTAGCFEGEFHRGNFRWLRAPGPDEIAIWLPDDKRERDLKSLLTMLRWCQAEGCRKRSLHAYFGFEDDFPLGPQAGESSRPATIRRPEGPGQESGRGLPGRRGSADAQPSVAASAAMGCATCDGEIASEAWLDARLPSSERVPVPCETSKPDVGGDGDAIQRGDWLDVQGHGLCAVVRVHRTSKGVKVDVERARDLQTFSFALGRLRWRKVTS